MDICRNHLESWLGRHGFANINVDFASDFHYDLIEHTIYCGMIDNDYDKIFEQYLYEYGCKYTDIWIAVSSFLHELGHAVTLSRFSEDQLKFFNFLKHMVDEDDLFTAAYDYWEVEDEFEANMFAINFINNNIEAVNELLEIMIEEFGRLYDDGEIWDYIDEVDVA